MVRRRRSFNILWLRNMTRESDYHGYETLIPSWLLRLEGGGSKYYGCEILKSPSIYLEDGDSEYYDCETFDHVLVSTRLGGWVQNIMVSELFQ
jgi:hypothetical protein